MYKITNTSTGLLKGSLQTLFDCGIAFQKILQTYRQLTFQVVFSLCILMQFACISYLAFYARKIVCILQWILARHQKKCFSVLNDLAKM